MAGNSASMASPILLNICSDVSVMNMRTTSKPSWLLWVRNERMNESHVYIVYIVYYDIFTPVHVNNWLNESFV